MKIETPKALSRTDLNNIVRKRGLKLKNGQYMLIKPLKVFKKVYHRDVISPGGRVSCIANLIIPIGAVVNLCEIGDNKFRASQAFCYSIVNIFDKKQVSEGYSGHDSAFKYHSGKMLGLEDKVFENMVFDTEKYEINQFSFNGRNKTNMLKKCKVVPDSFSSVSTRTCDNGIHFFHELASALKY